MKSKTINLPNVIEFPNCNKTVPDAGIQAAALIGFPQYKSLVMNFECEYARTFGIEKGDTVILDEPAAAIDGDLVICDVGGTYQLDAFDGDPGRSDVIGLLIGHVRRIERTAAALAIAR